MKNGQRFSADVYAAISSRRPGLSGAGSPQKSLAETRQMSRHLRLEREQVPYLHVLGACGLHSCGSGRHTDSAADCSRRRGETLVPLGGSIQHQSERQVHGCGMRSSMVLVAKAAERSTEGFLPCSLPGFRSLRGDPRRLRPPCSPEIRWNSARPQNDTSRIAPLPNR